MFPHIFDRSTKDIFKNWEYNKLGHSEVCLLPKHDPIIGFLRHYPQQPLHPHIALVHYIYVIPAQTFEPPTSGSNMYMSQRPLQYFDGAPLPIEHKRHPNLARNAALACLAKRTAIHLGTYVKFFHPMGTHFSPSDSFEYSNYFSG